CPSSHGAALLPSFLVVTPRPPRSPLFPYTTLFRSRQQGRCALVRGELPGGVRSVHLQRHPVQPRVPASRRDVRDAQDHTVRGARSEEHTSELQSRENLVCRLLLEKKKI